jgi:hypothetical protein
LSKKVGFPVKNAGAARAGLRCNKIYAECIDGHEFELHDRIMKGPERDFGVEVTIWGSGTANGRGPR